jgi:hypothetical protein
MNIVDRVKNICLSPNTEWPVIEAERTETGTLITGYVVPLAAIGAVAGFIGSSIIGLPFIGRVPIMSGLVSAIFTLAMAVCGVFVISLIINALAPTFGARQDSAQALKVAAYSFTPVWVLSVLNILPALGLLAILGGLYGIYLMFLGLPRLMNAPQDKAIPYTAVVVVASVVTMMVLSLVSGLIVGGSAAMSGMAGMGQTEFDPDSPVGRLEQMANAVEKAGAQMEQAQQSGDPNAQLNAAFNTLGAILGGGRHVEPLAIERLTPFVPETFAGLPKTDSSSERTGLASLMVSRAEATYSEGSRRVQLEIVDSGGASGLMGLASWVGVQGERETSSESERTVKQGDRIVHERISKTGGSNEFGILIGERFLISAEGNGIDIGTLRGAVMGLDLARLESLRNEGVQPQ